MQISYSTTPTTSYVCLLLFVFLLMIHTVATSANIQNCLQEEPYLAGYYRCSKCESGYVRYQESNASDRCIKCIDPNCIMCSLDGVCKICAIEFGLKADKSCTQCPQDCTECDQNGVCTKCVKTMAFVSSNSSCVGCSYFIQKCRECSNSTSCTLCDEYQSGVKDKNGNMAACDGSIDDRFWKGFFLILILIPIGAVCLCVGGCVLCSCLARRAKFGHAFGPRTEHPNIQAVQPQPMQSVQIQPTQFVQNELPPVYQPAQFHQAQAHPGQFQPVPYQQGQYQ